MKFLILLILCFINCSITSTQEGGAVEIYVLEGDSTAWVGVLDNEVIEMCKNGASYPTDTISFIITNDTVKWFDNRFNNYLLFIKEDL